MSAINKILIKDAKSRYEGITDDLHPIKSLVSDKILDYDLPTLVKSDFDYNKSTKLCNDIVSFKTTFYEKYPFLVGLDMKNLLVAGGSVGDIVRKQNNRGIDVDFFVYGLELDEANARVKQWVVDVINCAKKYVVRSDPKNKKKNKKESSSETETESDDVDSEDSPPRKYVPGGKRATKKNSDLDCIMVRNNNTLLMNIFGTKLQLIFRLYKTKSEILHGFDLGSSAVGFDGKQVFFTTLGKFCYEHSCNIIDTTRRSTTYECRLEKYFDRGFNIVLSKLDITKLRTEYFAYQMKEVCILPHFVFSYSDIVGNKISLHKFYNKYSITSDYQLEDIDEYKSFSVNIYNLVNDIDFFYYTSESTDTEVIDVLNKPPRLAKGSIIAFYEILKKNISNKNIDVIKLKQFLPIEKIATIVTNLVENKDPTYIDKLIQKQTDMVLKKLAKLEKRDHSVINWITQEPGTQISGSFNPIIKDEKDWYGALYVK
uniref:Uncharacterized protein n=1 Tax=viral metagenome TaxID=1070528 RepID=A0A6C0C7L9_9ZZZZ